MDKPQLQKWETTLANPTLEIIQTLAKDLRSLLVTARKGGLICIEPPMLVAIEGLLNEYKNALVQTRRPHLTQCGSSRSASLRLPSR